MKIYKKIIKESLNRKTIKQLFCTSIIDIIFFIILILGSKKIFAPQIETVMSKLQGVSTSAQILQVSAAKQSADIISSVVIAAIGFFVLYWFITFVLVGIKNTFIYRCVQEYKQKFFRKFVILNLFFSIFIFAGTILLAVIAKTETILSVLYAIFGIIFLHVAVIIQFYLKNDNIKSSVGKGLSLAFSKFHLFFGLYTLLFIGFVLLINILGLLASISQLLSNIIQSIMFIAFFEWLRIVAHHAFLVFAKKK